MLAEAQAINQSRSVNFAQFLRTQSRNEYQKTVMSLHWKFPKPVHTYKVLKFYGNNIVITEFDE